MLRLREPPRERLRVVVRGDGLRRLAQVLEDVQLLRLLFLFFRVAGGFGVRVARGDARGTRERCGVSVAGQ